MTGGPWRLRVANPGDSPLLSMFSCADKSVEWQRDVEEFVQFGLARWAFDPLATSGDPRLLLALHSASGELIGVAAHERVILQDGEGPQFSATKVEVVAIALEWQGRRFESGERASDVLMLAVMADISARVPPRDARVFGAVHEENVRSVALLRRHGFTQEMTRSDPDDPYRRLITAHR